MSEQLRIDIEAFDKFQRAYSNLIRANDQLGQSQDRVKRKTDDADRSVDGFLRTLGEVGILYAFQQGLQSVTVAGAQFETRIKSVQVVTDDFSDTLDRVAMSAEDGIHGPNAMAEAFENLGQAGLRTNEIVGSTADVLDFASAAQISMVDSASALISTAKSFQMEMSRSGEIADAFTVAMNAGSLAGSDFSWVMGSAGAVAKLANQDFREVLATASGMRDAGIQAQDAGTAIKSSLLALINPSDEAQKMIAKLGVQIYDASGSMRQWHEIVGEFERALAPYNEQARNMALTTIFGADGIRTMATSMNMGSDKLAALVAEMRNAEGATERVADVMEDTANGAIAKLNGNFERTKVLLFEDVQPAIMETAGTLNHLVVGFNKMDEVTRIFLFSLIGSLGLVAVLAILTARLKQAAAAMGLFTRAMWMNPVTAAVAAIGLVVSGLLSYSAAAARAKQEAAELAEKQRELNELMEESNWTRSSDDVSALQDRAKQEEELNKKFKQRTALLEEVTELEAAFAKNKAEAPLMVDGTELEKINALRKEIKAIDKEFADLGFTVESYQSQMAELKSDIERSVPALIEQRKAELDNAVAKGQSLQAMKDLKQEYDELSGKQNRNAQEQQRLNEVIDKLKAKIPALNIEIDKNGNKHLENAEKIDERVRIEQTGYDKMRDRLVEWLKQQQEVARQESRILDARLAMFSRFSDKASEFLGDNKKAVNAAGNVVSGLLGFGKALDWTGIGQGLLGAGKNLAASATDNAKNGPDQVIATLEDYINQLLNPVGDGKLGIGSLETLGGGGGNKGPSFLEKLRDRLSSITDAMSPFTSQTKAAADMVAFLGSKEQFLVSKWDDGAGSLRDLNALEAIRKELTKALTDQQADLNKENIESANTVKLLEAEQVKLDKQRRQGKITAEEYAEGSREIGREIESLTQSMRSNSQAWWEAENEKLNKSKAIADTMQATRDSEYQDAISLMRHEVAMSRMSTVAQISYLEELRDRHEWTQRQMWEIEEDLYSLRMQRIRELTDEINDALSDQMDTLRDAYDTERQRIEDNYNAQQRAIEDRERAKEKKELADEIAKYERATSDKGQKHLAELREQLRRIEVDENKQSLDDQKRDELRALQEEYGRNVKALETLRKAIQNNQLNMLTDEQFFQDERVKKWLETNKQIKEDIEELRRVYSQLPSPQQNQGGGSPNNAPQQGAGGGGQGGSSSSNQQKYLETLKATGTAGQSSWANEYMYLNEMAKNGTSGQQAWASAEMAKKNMPKYHTGGVAGEFNFRSSAGLDPDEMLALIRKGENVLTDKQVGALSAQQGMQPGAIESFFSTLSAGFEMLAVEIRKLGRVQQIIIEKVVEINDVRFEDELDARAMGREAGGAALDLMRRLYAGGESVG